MDNIKPLLLQALLFTLFVATLGYFSNSPAYQRYAADDAMIKLSLRHAGQILGECRQRSAEELAQLQATMRVAKICPRERSPLTLEMLINGQTVFAKTLPPRGLHKDGLSSVYFRHQLKAGKIKLQVRMKDHQRQENFAYQLDRTINLQRGQILVVDFDAEKRQFILL